MARKASTGGGKGHKALSKSRQAKVTRLKAQEAALEARSKNGNKTSQEVRLEQQISSLTGKKYIGKR